MIKPINFREGKAALQLLKLHALPHEIVKLEDEEILVHLKQAVQRAVGAFYWNP